MWTAVLQARPSAARCSAAIPHSAHRLGVDVEGGLVELDHIDADRRQFAGLFVEQPGEGHRQRNLVAVMGVGDRVDDRHRPGQGEFQPPLGVRASDCGLEGVDAPGAPERSGDGRHFGLVAVVADAHRDSPGEIDTLDVFEKTVHEVLTRLLAVGNDVDPGVFLLLQRQQCGVALRLGERLARELPRRPQHPGLGEPSRLRQRAGDRRLEHRNPQKYCARLARMRARIGTSGDGTTKLCPVMVSNTPI